MACGHACGSTTGVCSGWFVVEQGLHQGCVLAPLFFNIFLAAVTHVSYTRFEVDKGIMDALVGLRKKVGDGGTGENNGRKTCPGDVTMENAIR